MPQSTATHGIRTHVVTDTADSRGADCFSRRLSYVLHRQCRRPPQTCRIERCILCRPVVVRPAARGQQLRVAELTAQHLAGKSWVEHLHVYALLVHIVKTALGTKTRLPCLIKTLH